MDADQESRGLQLEDLRKWLPLATLAVLILVVGIVEPSFLKPAVLIDLASDTAVLFILATGVTFVIMLGGIDLSIQSMASLASVVVALTIARLGYGSFVLAIAIGGVAGLVSGIVHVRLKIPSFIATLAMGGVLFSAALVISRERSVTLDEAGRAYQSWITGQILGLPNVIIVGLIVLAAAHVLQAHTRFGRYSAAIGAGEPAAFASGVKVGLQKTFAFVLSAAFAALAGVILAGRLASGSPTLAAELLLPSIAAVVVGWDGDHRRRRQHLAHARRRADHFCGAHRHDIPWRRHFRSEYRVRRGAHRCSRDHDRSHQDPDREIVLQGRWCTT